MTKRRRIFVNLWLVAISLGAARAEPVHTDHVESELISEVTSIEPGKPFTVGLRMKMDEHWHTYWVNPGDSGMPTSIEWTLPPGFEAGPIQWPPPVRLPTPPLMTYGYTGEVLLMTQITPPADLEVGEPVTISAKADWLVCEHVCIPGSGSYSIQLPVAPGPASKDSDHVGLFASTRASLPVGADASWRPGFEQVGDSYRISFDLPEGAQIDPATTYFYVLDEMVIEPSKAQTVSISEGHVSILIKKSEVAETVPDNIRGVLVTEGNLPGRYAGAAVELDAPKGVAAAGASDTPAVLSPSLVLLALVGGLILNLMPCVFPVLGIKVLGFVNQSGSDRRKVTLHGLVFTLGVLVSFWVLAGMLIALRAGGQQLGWGFQLQSPVFVFVLAAFLLVFALNLSGLFEFGLSAVGVGSSLQSKSGFAGSFFTGVLATVVATPCAAPFLAPALGAAVALPPISSLFVFTAIGIGLSTPYLVLSSFPHLVKYLPRPGAWMETFKQLMAFPLYGTVGFLVWVLAGQLPDTGLLKVFFALVLIAMAAWGYGRWTQGGASGGRKVFGYGFTIVAAAIGLFLGIPAKPPSNAIAWKEWSPEAVAKLQSEGKTVYVDFTARWCATCQSNKALVFRSDAVREAFRSKGVVPLEADWTNKNPEITEALASFGRSAVPFNLIYPAGESSPVVLPEVLTPEIVLDALDKAAAPHSVSQG